MNIHELRKHSARAATGRARAVLTTAGAIGVLSIAAWNHQAPAAIAAPAEAALELAAGADLRTIGASQDSYADIVEAVAPTVVTVRSERRMRAPQQFPFMDDPMLREFFGDRLPRRDQMPAPRQQGLGSGVVVSADGYILTNHHVIDGAEEISIELTDRRRFDATVIGSDPPSDLAVLKIEAAGLPALPLGNSDAVRVGDIVLAVGNPLGVGQTVTLGIISAKGRATGLSDGSFEDFLQTDAPINQGNSGGALVNTRGELVGINSQILSPSGGNIGIGFAIPAEMARNVMNQLIEHGRVTRGLLGVTVQPVTPELAESLELPAIRGALVNNVQADGPADRAGLERGDVIVAVDGQAVENGNDLRNTIAETRPGDEVRLTVVRDGREREITATVDELPTEGRVTAAHGDDAERPGRLGLAVAPLTAADDASRLHLPAGTEGLLVAEVDPSGPAAQAGIRTGDVILEVNRRPVNSASGLRSAIQAGDGRPSLLLVHRNGTTLYVTVEAMES